MPKDHKLSRVAIDVTRAVGLACRVLPVGSIMLRDDVGDVVGSGTDGTGSAQAGLRK